MTTTLQSQSSPPPITYPPLPNYYGESPGTLLQRVETPLGQTWQQVARVIVPKRELTINIEPIPFLEWQKIVSFLVWSQKEHRQEAMIHGYYHPDTHDWIIEPPHQTPNGMTVGNDDHRVINNERDTELASQGYVMRFTTHHHCDAGAGQSGTDKDDEWSKPAGFHVTLGHMEKQTLDIHHRVVYTVPALIVEDQVLQPASKKQITNDQYYLLSFIENPALELIATYPEVTIDVKGFYTTPYTTPFPDSWKERIHIRPITTQITSNAGPIFSDRDAKIIRQASIQSITHYATWIWNNFQPKNGNVPAQAVFQSNAAPDKLAPELKLKNASVGDRQLYDSIYRFMINCDFMNLKELLAEISDPKITEKRLMNWIFQRPAFQQQRELKTNHLTEQELAEAYYAGHFPYGT
jgi:hypothetical protein